MGLPLQLAVDIAASWARLLIALLISIIFSLFVGIFAATSRRGEKIILPLLDIFQTIPILGFFPIVIFLIVGLVPGAVGINLAVIFLIFTSMSWNISFGVYEAVKSIPDEILELSELNHFSLWDRIRKIYVPSSLPRIAYQSMISFSIGFFYLATSEIFSTGSSKFAVVHGIGVEIANLTASAAPASEYVLALIFFVIAIILTRELLLEPLSIFSERFSLAQTDASLDESMVLKFYKSVYAFLVGKTSFLAKQHHARVRRAEIREGYPVGFEEPQLKKHFKKHKEFRHIYLVIFLMLLVLAITLLIHLKDGALELVVLTNLSASFTRVWTTYILSAAIALPIGIKIALSKKWFRPSMALLQVLSALPATILLPAIVTILALLPYFGELTAIVVIFISMFWYLLFSVVSGVRTIPESLLELAMMSKIKWTSRWRKVYIPAALPSFITGSVTAVGGAWNSLILAEYFSVQSGHATLVITQVGTGIGKLIDLAVFSGDLDLMILSIASMTIMVVVINRLFWQKLYSRVTSRYKLEV